ncbi:MAG: dTDP-4-amino-4,6-dideoxygalactose transaminase [Lachnospiraceae bacterium]|nr:dTDP-4-amino-4,6-dideoxygalactose transaminase [Lachnospiraceae bacterium]
MIKFNVPPYTGDEITYIEEAVKKRKICGDGDFTKLCNGWIEKTAGAQKALLTTSCTHALEMAAILSDVGPGDEVIMPSYTFVSTADAFVVRGARIVFVDIRPDTMNINEKLIEKAITRNTRVIVPVHYAGVGCEMDEICEIAQAYHLKVVEDAAQGIMSAYKGRMLGAIGDFGCYSFHETKNYSMGEGGAILIKDKKDNELAEIIREKGTDRSKFFRGEIDKYTWVEAGSSYLPSELNAAYLWAQLRIAEKINDERIRNWNQYYEELEKLGKSGKIELPFIPEHCAHNGHMFYIKAQNIQERTELIQYLKKKEILTVFHYIPLHSAPAGKRYGSFHGEDCFTTRESERLLRLPMYFGLKKEQITYITDCIKEFYA